VVSCDVVKQCFDLQVFMQQQQVLEVKTSCHTCVPVYSTGIVSLKPVVTPCVPVCSAGIVCLKPVVTPVYLFAQQVLYV